MSSCRITVIIVAALALAAEAVAQTGGGGNTPLLCQPNVTVTPQLRGEGYTEITGDITLSCTGGTAPAAGNSIPLVNITVFYNTTVTSRLLPSNSAPGAALSEALLLVDEPGSGLAIGYGSSLPQVLCTTPLTGCSAVVGSVAGPTYGTAVSSGSTPAPNVYQGIVSGSSVTFYGVPALAAGNSGTRVFRMTNLRVNAVPLSGGVSGATPVQASLSISGSTALALSTSNLSVGFVQNGLSASVTNSLNLSQCTSQTLTSAATLSFSENFGTAFKTRVVPQSSTNYAGQTNHPGFTDLSAGSVVNPNQNTPGGIYNSESDFVFPIGTQVA